MTTQSDLHVETQMFATLMTLEMNDRDRGARGGWQSDARLEVLAHEVVRYLPELAKLLVQSGKAKMAA